MDPSILGHLANFLFAAAYLVKDILWLRLISMLACFIMIFFNYYTPEEPLWVAIFWNFAFIAVNAIRSMMLLVEKQQAKFSDVEKEMYDTIFSNLSPVEFAKILRLGYWKYFKPESTLIKQGERPNSLILLYNGSAAVSNDDDNRIIELRDGAFIGEMSMVSGGFASATVTANTRIKAYCWSLEQLDKLFRFNPNMKSAFQTVIASDMARKLKSR